MAELGSNILRERRTGFALLAALVLVFGVLTLGSGTARAAGPQALILASSVSPGFATDGSGKSLEQQQAEADGFTVTLVDDPTWSSMTAAQFAAYQVIIIGDPDCGSNTGAGSVAQSNASVWEPVVMSSGGNKVLIGTDPTYHNNGPTGTQRGDLLEKNGIAFAGALTGATGAYVDLSCTYDSSPAGTPVPILDGLSTHGPGGFTAVGEGPLGACGTGINIVAQSGPTSGLTDADLSNWGCSVHEAFDKFPSDYTPLALAPASSGFPTSYCANDVGTGALACGSPYVMVSGGGVVVTSNVTLTPASQSLAAGGSASLVANVALSGGGGPVVGGSVVFTVDSGPNVNATFTGTTDSTGNATFTYPDTGGPGTDSISATYTDSHGVSQKATATVTWTAAVDPAITATGKTGTLPGKIACGSVATFVDPDPAATASEYTDVINWGDGTTTSVGGIVRSGKGGFFEVSVGTTACHTYKTTGTFTVTTTITDVDNPSNTATATSTVTRVH